MFNSKIPMYKNVDSILDLSADPGPMSHQISSPYAEWVASSSINICLTSVQWIYYMY
jgi:hypothetical protein